MSVQIQASGDSEENPPRNLWINALNALDDDVRKGLDSTNISRGNAVAEVLKSTREKQQLCAKKSFTFKNHNGKVIVLRDVLGKIALWIEKFVAVGDAAMQYDTLHAAPAWATFRFVLQVKLDLLDKWPER